MRALDYAAKQPRFLISAEGLALVILLGVIDYLTGWEFSFAIFYLIPIFLVVNYAGRRLGILTSLASAASWLIADLLSGPPYTHPVVPFWNAGVRLGFFIIFTFTLSSLRRALDHEKELAWTDSLTGVKNNRSFYRGAAAEIERAKRYSHPFTVAYIDLDNFKQVNDCSGHHRGDSLLRVVASTLQAHTRTTDLVARLGGDEFAVLLPETGYEAAQVVLLKLQQFLLERMHQGGYPVTFSIGAATFATPPASVDDLIHKADDLMYSVKRNGKDGLRHEVVGWPHRSLSRPHTDFGPATTAAAGTNRAIDRQVN